MNSGCDVFGQADDVINHLFIVGLNLLFNIALVRGHGLGLNVHLR